MSSPLLAADDVAHERRGDGKSQPLGALRYGLHDRHAEDLTVLVHQGPTAAPWADRCRELDVVVNTLRANRAHDAGGDAVVQPQGCAGGDHRVTDRRCRLRLL